MDSKCMGIFGGFSVNMVPTPPPTPTLSGKFNLIELTKLLKVGIGTHLYPKTPPPLPGKVSRFEHESISAQKNMLCLMDIITFLGDLNEFVHSKCD